MEVKKFPHDSTPDVYKKVVVQGIGPCQVLLFEGGPLAYVLMGWAEGAQQIEFSKPKSKTVSLVHPEGKTKEGLTNPAPPHP